MKIQFDADKCTGCMACQMACMDQRDTKIDGVERPLRFVELREKDSSLRYYSVGCVHCGKCMNSCPAHAMERDSQGYIQVDPDKCVGCGTCVRVCPLGVITLTGEQKAKKCDGCATRIENGFVPACVHTCPTGALWLK